jgi:NMD protein affecting ribosome stability and mRNA decay
MHPPCGIGSGGEMKSIRQPRPASRAGRRTAGRAQRDHVLDPYQARQKLQEPTACRQCGAVYHSGRWQWGPTPSDAREDLCPACHRINDRFPAGTVTLHGDIARQRKDEIIGLARNEEAAEKGEHPLNRIVDIEETDQGLVISTTDIHLPRRIGEALKQALHGELAMHFDEAGYFVRVDWRAPA